MLMSFVRRVPEEGRILRHTSLLNDDLALASPNQTCLEQGGRQTGWENVARTRVSLLSASLNIGLFELGELRSY